MSSTQQARKGDIFAAFWLGESRSYQSLSRHKKKVLQQSRKKRGDKRIRNHMSMASVPPRHKKKITQSPASFVPGIQGTPNQHLPPPHTHTHTVNTGHTCKPRSNLSLCFWFPSWEFYLWRGSGKQEVDVASELRVRELTFFSPNSVEICQGTNVDEEANWSWKDFLWFD